MPSFRYNSIQFISIDIIISIIIIIYRGSRFKLTRNSKLLPAAKQLHSYCVCCSTKGMRNMNAFNLLMESQLYSN